MGSSLIYVLVFIQSYTLYYVIHMCQTICSPLPIQNATICSHPKKIYHYNNLKTFLIPNLFITRYNFYDFREGGRLYYEPLNHQTKMMSSPQTESIGGTTLFNSRQTVCYSHVTYFGKEGDPDLKCPPTLCTWSVFFYG